MISQITDLEMSVQREIGYKNINDFSLSCLFIKFYCNQIGNISFEDIFQNKKFADKPYVLNTLKNLLSSIYTDSVKDTLNFFLSKYCQIEIDEKTLQQVILGKAKRRVSEYTCYSPIYKTMQDILNIQENDIVFNPAVGLGEVFYDLQGASHCFVKGIDSNLFFVDFTKIILDVISIRSDIKQYNYDELTLSYSADKIISFLPVGFNQSQLNESFIRLRNNNLLKYLSVKPRQTETLLLDICLALLKDKGKATVLVPASFLMRTSEKDIRKKILQDDILEAVIELPTRYFLHMGAATAILVFDKDKQVTNSILSINMKNVPAKEFELIPQLVWQEYTAKKESVYSRIIVVDTACIEEAKLNFAISLESKRLSSVCDSTVILEEIAKDLIKGIATIKKKNQPDELEKNAFLLTAVNIADNELNYGKSEAVYADEKEIFLQAVHKGDIIVSCRGSFKCLYVEEEPKDTLLISDNLMIIRVDSSKYNPVVLAYLLNSETGKAMIADQSTGMNMFMLSPKSLKSVQLPAYSIETADKVGAEILQNMRVYKEALQKAKAEYELVEQNIQSQLNLK